MLKYTYLIITIIISGIHASNIIEEEYNSIVAHYDQLIMVHDTYEPQIREAERKIDERSSKRILKAKPFTRKELTASLRRYEKLTRK